ncbi:hypothetical protein Pst134EA_011672 [Puccinia striiformis f. sp. tritici]|uniref:hypothetical protein n=1 Tax=Puccinia striiformis f. sp. tritici TaxID=168172 RepID=UPI0020077B8C|nr:hypothetical protein Pst134EA_011672 [Puccinia striiformis f. sp. tritici]KAH9456440.1 hypothetical protein Pst134EB_012638 [Puccinia striiformis f. sp. tritici]KAH9468051.1 hypothetical protein Pst134EA_011672 [Puccinia striiformis f. sp. tritici]
MNHQIYERIPLPVLPFHVYRAQLDGPSTATTSSILPTPPGSDSQSYNAQGLTSGAASINLCQHHYAGVYSNPHGPAALEYFEYMNRVERHIHIIIQTGLDLTHQAPLAYTSTSHTAPLECTNLVENRLVRGRLNKGRRIRLEFYA